MGVRVPLQVYCFRKIAQLGRVLALGARCRRFESCFSDSRVRYFPYHPYLALLLCFAITLEVSLVLLIRLVGSSPAYSIVFDLSYRPLVGVLY